MEIIGLISFKNFQVTLRGIYDPKMKSMIFVMLTISVADLGGGVRGSPPGRPNSFDFMQFSGKFSKIVCWRPPWQLAPPGEILDPSLHFDGDFSFFSTPANLNKHFLIFNPVTINA